MVNIQHVVQNILYDMHWFWLTGRISYIASATWHRYAHISLCEILYTVSKITVLCVEWCAALCEYDVTFTGWLEIFCLVCQVFHTPHKILSSTKWQMRQKIGSQGFYNEQPDWLQCSSLRWSWRWTRLLELQSPSGFTSSLWFSFNVCSSAYGLLLLCDWIFALQLYISDQLPLYSTHQCYFISHGNVIGDNMQQIGDLSCSIGVSTCLLLIHSL